MSIFIPVRAGYSLTEIGNDGAALIENLNDPEVFRVTLRVPFPYTSADATWFAKYVAETTERQRFVSHFALRNDAGKLVGSCGFDGVTRGHRAEVSYWVARPLWGQGLGSDMIRAACHHAFAEWDLVRISALVFDFNAASARLLEKCGFQQEGLLRKHLRKGDTFIDCKLFALLKQT